MTLDPLRTAYLAKLKEVRGAAADLHDEWPKVKEAEAVKRLVDEQKGRETAATPP